MSLLTHLRAAMRQFALPANARVLVAVSGGPDSLCLLHALYTLRYELRLELHVAHLDHGFRGPQSAAEAEFVRAFAEQLGLPATIERRDVPALALKWHMNAQAAARRVRYTFLADLARAQNAQAVAVAHQADDQAETVLMHLLRGAGPAGLRGMRPLVPWQEWAAQTENAELRIENLPWERHSQFSILNCPLIRPLLQVERQAIEDYCAAHALDPRRDPSNESLRYTRSRIRSELLPALGVYNAQITRSLTHTALICADDYDFMLGKLNELWPALAKQGANLVRFHGEQWRALHPALQRYALRRAVQALAGEEPSFEQLEAARYVATLPVGARCDLPGGLLLLVEYGGFALWQGEPQPGNHLPQLRVPELVVAVPGVTALGGGWLLEVRQTEPPDWQGNAWQQVFDAAVLGESLLLRGRKPGDRMYPAGRGGGRSVQNLFVDLKLPRALRAAWPLLVAATGIAWAVGLRADTRVLATEATQHRLWLRCYLLQSDGTAVSTIDDRR